MDFLFKKTSYPIDCADFAMKKFYSSREYCVYEIIVLQLKSSAAI